MIKSSTYLAMYRLLNKVSMIPYDCGKICNKACCVPIPGYGINLYAGETSFFAEYIEEDFCEESYCFVKCIGPSICIRELRPLQCRFYPVLPHIMDNNELVLLMCNPQDREYDCPLVSEKVKLDIKFLKAVHTVCRRLIKEDSILITLLLVSSERNIEDYEIIYRL